MEVISETTNPIQRVLELWTAGRNHGSLLVEVAQSTSQVETTLVKLGQVNKVLFNELDHLWQRPTS